MINPHIVFASILLGVVSAIPAQAGPRNLDNYFPAGQGYCYIVTNDNQSLDLTKVKSGVYSLDAPCGIKIPLVSSPAAQVAPTNQPPQPAAPPTNEATAPPPFVDPLAEAAPAQSPSAYQRFSGIQPPK